MATKEEIDSALDEVCGAGGAQFSSNTDRLLAAILVELRVTRKQQLPVPSLTHNVSTDPGMSMVTMNGPSMYIADTHHSTDKQELGWPVTVRALRPGDDTVSVFRLSYSSDRKISVIKSLRSALGLSLREAKDLSESPTFTATVWQYRQIHYALVRDLGGAASVFPA